MITYSRSFWKSFDDMFKDFSEVWNDFDKIFEGCGKLYPNFPPTDIFIKKDKAIVLNVAVAGYPEDNIGMEIHGDKLVIKLEPIKEKGNDNDKKFIKQGIRHSKCTAEYYVPSDKYKTDEINANLKNGILTIEVPAKEAIKPKKIEIKKD